MLFRKQDERRNKRGKTEHNGKAVSGDVQLVISMDERFDLAKEIVKVTKAKENKNIFLEKSNS
jgi:hypothetical protein